MRKRNLAIGTAFILIWGVGLNHAQDAAKPTKEAVDMTEMKKSAHHALMMAHHHSALSFASALRDMTKDGKFEDIDMARNAFAEVKHCMDKMDEIHKSHMAKMSPEKMESMKPMMEKMKAEKAATAEHILALDKAFAAATPDAVEVGKHAAALVAQLEKMGMHDQKKDMSEKKPM